GVPVPCASPARRGARSSGARSQRHGSGGGPPGRKVDRPVKTRHDLWTARHALRALASTDLATGPTMHELVIRGGTVVDGTGAPAATADVAVDGGRITEVGRVEGRGERELDADGLVVAPGWVDIHTHYDGQVTWDPELTPSSWHGVTTVV